MHTHRRYNFKNQHFAGQEGRLIPLLQQAVSYTHLTLPTNREV